ncbi:MAG: hypothetical protein JXB62_10155 [Pirellulales bacterium]|nr:hypothetical protein [Pirellulales bacterium]
MTVSNRYYSEFASETFVIQAEAEAVENAATMLAVLQGAADLLRHGIRVLLVFGKGTQFEEELRAAYGARPHPETNRLVIPEVALPRILEERSRIARAIEQMCRDSGVPSFVLGESVIRVERRIGHGSTGVVTEIRLQAIRSALDEPRLAIVGFGGADERRQFLHVPSVSLAADLAVELAAQKLLFLTHEDGIFLPDRQGSSRQLSFADLEQLLCLLQRRDPGGAPVVSETMLPKVHACIRAVAGGVSQIHLVSYSRLLEEILTRTGVGTMVERRQSHHVDYAQAADLDEIERLHVESQRYTSPRGTPYVKPLDRSTLRDLLPRTLLLKHRGIVIGKLHTLEVPGASNVLQLGGFVIAESHHDSQQGQLLLSEALGRLREQGVWGTVAITASEKASRLFRRLGGTESPAGTWQTALLKDAARRYAPEERGKVQLFEFPLTDNGARPSREAG